MSNAFNLIDGLDGLAAGVGLFSTTTLFIACVINERWEIAIIAAALGGALLGFLRYNFNPASIFLGDSGALFVGFALAAIAVRGSMKSSAAIAVAAPLMALAVPILDASIAVVRRFVRGDDVFRADGDHIHHRLLRMGLTPRRVVATHLRRRGGVRRPVAADDDRDRGQIVGMVVIASSIVTWIGVQQLGYAEFAEIQRSLRYGFGNERKAIGNNVYLASLTQRLRRGRGPRAPPRDPRRGGRRVSNSFVSRFFSMTSTPPWRRRFLRGRGGRPRPGAPSRPPPGRSP